MATPYITIRLFAFLRPFTPKNADRYPITPGQTVQTVLEQLKIPPEEIQLVFVDGVKTDISAPLAGGERVGVFPPVGGG
jgi:molybdopterin converting factor small subunit